MKDGRDRWNYIHRLQRISAGRRPVRPTAVLKEDGELTQGPTEVLEHWHQHFQKLLNVNSVLLYLYYLYVLILITLLSAELV